MLVKTLLDEIVDLVSVLVESKVASNDRDFFVRNKLIGVILSVHSNESQVFSEVEALK